MSDNPWTIEFINKSPFTQKEECKPKTPSFEKIKQFLKKEYNVVYTRIGHTTNRFGMHDALYFKLPIFNVEFFVSDSCSVDTDCNYMQSDDLRIILRQAADMIEENLKEFIHAK